MVEIFALRSHYDRATRISAKATNLILADLVVDQKVPQEDIDAEKHHVYEKDEREVAAKQGLTLDDWAVLFGRVVVPEHVEKCDWRGKKREKREDTGEKTQRRMRKRAE